MNNTVRNILKYTIGFPFLLIITFSELFYVLLVGIICLINDNFDDLFYEIIEDIIILWRPFK
jgi:hypothetical protein